MDCSKHPMTLHAKISKSATFEQRYFGRLCSNFAPKDIISRIDMFLSFYLNAIFKIGGFTTKKNFALCMLHFFSSSAVYEPILIGFVHRLSALLRDFWYLRGNFFPSLWIFPCWKLLRDENSYKWIFNQTLRKENVVLAHARPRFCFYQTAADNFAGSNAPNF